METPLISMIVPVYNVRPFLDDCFNSLQKQNYPKLEIIIIDDGSTDGSGVFCDEFAKKDARVRVIHQENQGLSAARNRGLEAARGEYLTFVDSDDYVAPDYVSYLYGLVSKYQVPLSICAVKEVTLKNKEIFYAADFPEKLMSTEEALGRMLREEGFTVVAYAKLYHRDLWKGIEFPVGAIHEDLGTTYRIITQCQRVAFGPEPKYVYRKRQDSLSLGEFSDRKFDIIKLTDEMCDGLEARFPYLVTTINLRRMHARFSVLRQLVLAKNLTPEQEQKEQKIIAYLKSHKKFITKNPYATHRDKIAMYALLAGKKFFKSAWQTYSTFRP